MNTSCGVSMTPTEHSLGTKKTGPARPQLFAPDHELGIFSQSDCGPPMAPERPYGCRVQCNITSASGLSRGEDFPRHCDDDEPLGTPASAPALLPGWNIRPYSSFLGAEKRLVGMTGRWAVCCRILIVVSTSFPASTFAQNKIDDEARSVTAGCHEALKRTGQLQTFEVGCAWEY